MGDAVSKHGGIVADAPQRLGTAWVLCIVASDVSRCDDLPVSSGYDRRAAGKAEVCKGLLPFPPPSADFVSSRCETDLGCSALPDASFPSPRNGGRLPTKMPTATQESDAPADSWIPAHLFPGDVRTRSREEMPGGSLPPTRASEEPLGAADARGHRSLASPRSPCG
jgi:hypothetical protein